jgi:hypothetical protein
MDGTDNAGSDGGNDDTDSDKDNDDNDDNDTGNDDTGSIRRPDTFQIVCRPYKIPPLIFHVIIEWSSFPPFLGYVRSAKMYGRKPKIKKLRTAASPHSSSPSCASTCFTYSRKSSRCFSTII